MPNHPPYNILFIFADQMHRYAMHCMGTEDIHTPHLDRLAEQGVLFTNAYSNCPICGPFRINLFTGLYTCQTGTYGNGDRIPENTPTLAGTLNACGYHTSYVGKWHIGGAGNIPIPRELRGDFTDFIAYQCYNGFYQDVVFYDEANVAHSFDRHRTCVTTDLALQRLERMDDHPFTLFISYQAPHYPEQPDPEYVALYRDVIITRRPNSKEIDPYTRTYSPPSPQPPELCPDYQRYGNNLDEYLRLYYGMVSQIDTEVGRLMDALERLGVADRTVVLFTSDHGDMQGSHGLKNKSLPHEESAGIPLIVRVPGGATGVISDALVSGIDYFPTCLAYAGAPIPAALPGTSFALLTYGADQGLVGPIFSEMEDWAMVREGDWKLVIDKDTGMPTMLINLRDDPYEQNNLVGKKGFDAVSTHLQQRLREWQARCVER
jgi:arylsulfatase A-like enzyme